MRVGISGILPLHAEEFGHECSILRFYRFSAQFPLQPCDARFSAPQRPEPARFTNDLF
jgi:hypothetical protein